MPSVLLVPENRPYHALPNVYAYDKPDTPLDQLLRSAATTARKLNADAVIPSGEGGYEGNPWLLGYKDGAPVVVVKPIKYD
jgi:hypothetical protein